MKTIRRNTKKFQDVLNNATNIKVHDLSTAFKGIEVESLTILREQAQYSFAKLQDNGDGSYTLRVTSNCWYKFE